MYVRCQYVQLSRNGGVVMLVALATAAVAPYLTRLVVQVQLPLVGEADVLPE